MSLPAYRGMLPDPLCNYTEPEDHNEMLIGLVQAVQDVSKPRRAILCCPQIPFQSKEGTDLFTETRSLSRVQSHRPLAICTIKTHNHVYSHQGNVMFCVKEIVKHSHSSVFFMDLDYCKFSNVLEVVCGFNSEEHILNP